MSRKPVAEPEAPPTAVESLTTPVTVPLENRYRRHREERTLMRDLHATELVDRGRRLAAIQAELARIEGDLEQARATAKSAAKLLESEAVGLGSELRSGKIPVEVEVEIEFDFVDGVARTTRLDTGEVFGERPLTYPERQLEIKLA